VRDRDLIEAGRSLVCAESDALRLVARDLDGRLLAAARILLSATGKVLPVGVGTSGETARRMAHLLAFTGTPALFLHPTDGLHGGLGGVVAGDVVVAISKGGQSAELNEFTRLARDRGATIIILTGDGASPLAALGDLTVVFETPEGADPRGIVAMGSTLAVAAWGDALAVVAMQMRGYDWDEALSTHPGGAVGLLAAVEPGS
jgi:D-arabinose 5-phosphate isomerase GutQ